MYIRTDGLSYKILKEITPHNTTVQPEYAAIMSTADAGDVEITDRDGNTTVMYCLQGVIYPVSPYIVKAANTTVTTLIGLL